MYKLSRALTIYFSFLQDPIPTASSSATKKKSTNKNVTMIFRHKISPKTQNFARLKGKRDSEQRRKMHPSIRILQEVVTPSLLATIIIIMGKRYNGFSNFPYFPQQHQQPGIRIFMLEGTTTKDQAQYNSNNRCMLECSRQP